MQGVDELKEVFVSCGIDGEVPFHEYESWGGVHAIDARALLHGALDAKLGPSPGKLPATNST